MDLLLAWERGLDQSPARRALALLGACSPDIASDKLAALPVGARDARLLRLRESLFGDSIAAVSRCPECGEKLDVAFNVDDVLDAPPEAIDKVIGDPGIQAHHLNAGDYDVTYRLPTSADLIAVSLLPDDSASQQALLQRCVIGVQQSGVSTTIDMLPDTVITALSNDMANADPHAQIELALNCPACDHAWHSLFDIASFLWSEIHAWAQRILHEVHTLARAYGWRELDILTMSPTRRQIYLDLAQS
ncbi:hypothetical protein SAMN05216316_0921 [Nitrosovibrio sp. Nv6]|nr:hypothetical protein SAMN05216316_0921 [Nitrosovibrio sp. Nv6]